MSHRCALLGIFVLDLCICGKAQDVQKSLRKALLDEARLRINVWHRNASLLEDPLVKNDIALNMLKHDLKCGGNAVPVGFAEFEVVGARPVDVFNTVMNVAAQPTWNPKCDSMKHVGDWPEEGARGWDNVFNLIFDKKIEFLVWQVADIDYAREEFWMVTSTKHNSRLREKSPKKENWIESDNCLGAYYISKSARGSHVVITQHVNAAVGLWFPYHAILEVFPIAWKGMIDFIAAMSEQSRRQASIGWSVNKTVIPSWMVPGSVPIRSRNASSGNAMTFNEEPMGQTAAERQWLRIFATSSVIFCLLCCCIALTGVIHYCNRPAFSSRVSETASTCSHRSDLSDWDGDDEFHEYL